MNIINNTLFLLIFSALFILTSCDKNAPNESDVSGVPSPIPSKPPKELPRMPSRTPSGAPKDLPEMPSGPNVLPREPSGLPTPKLLANLSNTPKKQPDDRTLVQPELKFECDGPPLASDPELPPYSFTTSSALAKILRSKSDIALNAIDTKTFFKEFNAVLEISLGGRISYDSDEAAKNEGQKFLKRFDGKSEIVVTKDEIREIAKFVDDSFTKAKSIVQNDPYFFSRNIGKLFADYLKDVPPSEEGKADWNGKLGDFFKAFIRDMVQLKPIDALEKGLFADKTNTWLTFLRSYPIFYKVMQRGADNYDLGTPEGKKSARYLKSLLVSHPFDVNANGKAVKALKMRFGNDARVEALAEGSMAKTFLVSCTYKGKSRKIVAKTANLSLEELNQQIAKELSFFKNHYELLSFFPESEKRDNPFNIHVDPEDDQEWARRERAKLEKKRKTYLAKIKEDIRKKLVAEINFKQEADNLGILKKAYENLPSVKIVQGATEEVSGMPFLFMDYITGKPLSEIENISKETAQSLLAFIKSLYAHLLFSNKAYHADTHWGNIIVDGQQITLIDAGHIVPQQEEADRLDVIAYEELLRLVNSFNVVRSDDSKEAMFSVEQQKKIENFDKNAKDFWYLKKQFAEWVKKNYQLSFRKWFIDYWAGGGQNVALVKVLKAIELLDKTYEKFIFPHLGNTEYFFGDIESLRRDTGNK